MNRLIKTTVVTLVCLSAISCASPTVRNETTSGERSGAQGNPTASSPAVAGFDLVNFSGSPIRAVYLSPGDSNGWEENVLGTDILEDGATVDIRFVSNKAPALWDMKVVARSGYYAEWKGLDLRGVSRVTLAMARIDGPAVVAELE